MSWAWYIYVERRIKLLKLNNLVELKSCHNSFTFIQQKITDSFLVQ